MFGEVLERTRESKEEHQAMHISAPGHDDTSWKRGREDGMVWK